MSSHTTHVAQIINTDASCKIKGQSWPDIPTIVWLDGIDEVASDWLRSLVVDNGIAASSAREYAKVLRPFLRSCRTARRAWWTVDDDFLIIWREHLRRAQQLSVSRVNTSLTVIFAFFRWAEEKKYIRYTVAIYPQDELPGALRHVPFPISAKRFFSKGPHGRVFGNWTTPLTISKGQSASKPRHTPTEPEIRDLHEVATELLNGERDSLILSWAEEAGLRRAEFLRLKKSQLPTDDQLSHLIDLDEPWLMEIMRKGGRLKMVNALPDLLIRTLDYIAFSRRTIIDKCLKSIVGYREPAEIFISSTTGMPLHMDSVTSIGGRTFRKAGVKRASIHRLRARFAVRTIETLVDAMFNGEMVGPESAWFETILVKAAEIMGHSNPSSLRPYLNYVLNRRIQLSDATKAEKLASRLRQLTLLEGTLVRRLSEQRELQSAANHLRSGRKDEAAALLRDLANQLAN